MANIDNFTYIDLDRYVNNKYKQKSLFELFWLLHSGVFRDCYSILDGDLGNFVRMFMNEFQDQELALNDRLLRKIQVALCNLYLYLYLWCYGLQ